MLYNMHCHGIRVAATRACRYAASSLGVPDVHIPYLHRRCLLRGGVLELQREICSVRARSPCGLFPSIPQLSSSSSSLSLPSTTPHTEEGTDYSHKLRLIAVPSRGRPRLVFLHKGRLTLPRVGRELQVGIQHASIQHAPSGKHGTPVSPDAWPQIAPFDSSPPVTAVAGGPATAATPCVTCLLHGAADLDKSPHFEEAISTSLSTRFSSPHVEEASSPHVEEAVSTSLSTRLQVLMSKRPVSPHVEEAEAQSPLVDEAISTSFRRGSKPSRRRGHQHLMSERLSTSCRRGFKTSLSTRPSAQALMSKRPSAPHFEEAQDLIVDEALSRPRCGYKSDARPEDMRRTSFPPPPCPPAACPHFPWSPPLLFFIHDRPRRPSTPTDGGILALRLRDAQRSIPFCVPTDFGSITVGLLAFVLVGSGHKYTFLRVGSSGTLCQ
ncbi:hypothetical protein M409DRAFT_60318 [Zasmidium cellare ATCC 36951]|uniref:Uncharacterized protein n=1 Tax=Zasmidium cellare ATCC 36951 TaxID=1080233 RepID=A0A6A6C3U6_ZASCE|nr:uncharacterized protein M409DRAFT_60318 [Zasmidium cellare ATCC 36951]KAF2160066.1 hypothetical protein M409DRAFT_60318 [Zasmidium cellare ATCC 36951]